jgi:glycolate oxidase
MAEAPLRELKAALPTGTLLQDPAQLAEYGGDESGMEPVCPLAVVQARSIPDIQESLRWASRYGVAVTPRGAGTGKAGGCVPEPGGIVLALAEMNNIQAVYPEHGFAEVEPGVITGPFRDHVEQEYRLFYPPDPNSLDTCTLGGNVATNAGGPVALRYGVTGNFVLGVTAVCADGTVIETGRRQPKGVTGYDLSSLLVGSEGTLAVIAGIRLSLLPQPREVGTALLAFADLESAVAAVARARLRGLSPRALELVDGHTLERVRQTGLLELEDSWGSLLLVEFDGEPGQPALLLERFVNDLGERAPLAVRRADGEEERRSLWELRRRLSKLVKQGACGYLSEDVAVPVGSIPALVDAIAPIAQRRDVVLATYGHAGDGNLHVNILWYDEGGAERGEKAADEVIRATLDLGGTISGEHGLGLLKRRFLAWEQDSHQIALQRSLRRAWDPAGVLNPSKVLARETA